MLHDCPAANESHDYQPGRRPKYKQDNRPGKNSNWPFLLLLLLLYQTMVKNMLSSWKTKVYKIKPFEIDQHVLAVVVVVVVVVVVCLVYY